MTKQEIADLIRALIGKMGMSVDDVSVSEAAGHTLFMIATKDSGALIGARGDTLHALNHVIKKALEEKIGDDSFRFVVDVNGYHLKHIKSLEAQARMLAERARTFKYNIEMSPMSAYDRLIVHSTLQGSPQVATESEGEGALRHIVIKFMGDAPASPGAESASVV